MEREGSPCNWTEPVGPLIFFFVRHDRDRGLLARARVEWKAPVVHCDGVPGSLATDAQHRIQRETSTPRESVADTIGLKEFATMPPTFVRHHASVRALLLHERDGRIGQCRHLTELSRL